LNFEVYSKDMVARMLVEHVTMIKIKDRIKVI